MASEPLKKLLQDVNSGQLVLPQFQRDFVWQPSAVLKLLTSLFNGYPIGSLLLMENNKVYDFRLIDGVPNENKKDDQENVLILDGQQRLTACYRAFYGTLKAQKYPGRYYLNYNEFVRRKEAGEEVDGSSLEDLFVFHRPAKVSKELSNTAAEHSAGLFPLDVIFSAPRGSNYADWMQRYNFSMAKGDEARFEKLSSVSSNFVSDFIEKVTSYQVNYEKITRDTKPDVICTVFETINTTGVKLTVFDLLVAKCFKSHIRLRDMLEDSINRFENLKYFDSTGNEIAAVQLPRIIGLLHNGQCRKGDLLQLPASVIGEQWTNAVNSLEKLLKLLRTEFGCVKADFIPSTDVIAPLAVMLADPKYSNSLHLGRFRRLYWNLVFSLYLSGAPETKSARLVREWKQDGYRDNPEAEPEVVRTFTFNDEELDESTKASSVYRGVLTLLISNGIVDFGVDKTLLKGAINGVSPAN